MVVFSHQLAKMSKILRKSLGNATESSTIGLRTCREPASPNDPNDPVINIVFVHGLGGSAKGTWTHEGSQSFWPLWLPEIPGLENVGIMTFGYNADYAAVWKPKKTDDIRNFATRLVNSLYLHIEIHENVVLTFFFQLLTDLQEKFVFVAHSMGGLVVKEVKSFQRGPNDDRHST